jgi:hypothetical protein
MRSAILVAIGSMFLLLPAKVSGQGKKNEEDFVKEKPAIGDTIPDLTVYSPDGSEVKTSDLRGQHVVLTFGCLT